MEPHEPSQARSARSERPPFEARFDEIAPALFAWAELRIRPFLRSRLVPQDLVQEVLLRGRKNFDRFDQQTGSFRAWSFRIAKNVLLEAVRASRTAAIAEAGTAGATGFFKLDQVPQSVTSFTQRLAREDTVLAFLAHAESLPETDRMLLVHCGLEAEACASAAVKLGLTEDAAIKRWQRLKGKLSESHWARGLLGLDDDGGPSLRALRDP